MAACSREEVSDGLVRILDAQAIDFDPETMGDDTTFEGDLDLDSLDTVELIMAIEEWMFDEKGKAIKIPDEVAKEMKTVGHVIGHLTGQGVPGVENCPIVVVHSIVEPVDKKAVKAAEEAAALESGEPAEAPAEVEA